MVFHRVSKHIALFTAVMLLSGAALFAQSNMNSGQNDSMSANSGQASNADKIFAQKAMQGGMAEVQLGQLAAQNGGSEDVKEFGQRMVDDHSKLNDQMKPIAQQIGVEPPTQLSAKDQALLTKLQGESGKQFDDTYIRAMVKDHRMDLKQFRKEARSGGDPALKQAAESGAQVIQQHLQQVEQLAQAHNITTGSMHSSLEGNSASGAQ